jgi:dephospho-CoA kinase
MYAARIIGLTGLYCAGKNYLASLLEARGIPCLDVDKLGHAALNNLAEKIANLFGAGVRNPDGTINRKALGALVFGTDPGAEQRRLLLESLVHPEVNRLSDEWLKAQGNKPCVLNAALLHKCTAFSRISSIIIVRCPFPERLFRAMKRDGLSFKAAWKRLASQENFSTQYRAAKADKYYIDNSAFRAGRLMREGRNAENQLDSILKAMKLEV